MDLSTVKIDNDPVDLVIKHPKTNENTDVVFKVIGHDSDDYKTVDRLITKEVLKKYASKGMIDISKIPTEDAEDMRLRRIAACVVGWSGLTEDEKEVKFSKFECTRILSQYPFFADQVEDFCADRANFIKGF